MKLFIAMSLLVSASAFAQITVQKGTSVLEDERGTSRSTIEIKGAAAQLMFDKLSDKDMYSIDGRERGGRHAVYKSGVNYNCQMLMGNPGRSNEYSCAIPLINKGRGIVGEAGVAHPARNSSMTRSSGKATVEHLRVHLQSQEMVIAVEGLSAERIYHSLNSRVERSGGPGEQVSGDFVDSKSGENISCTKRTRRNTPVRFGCGMTVESAKKGIITVPGVG